MRIAEIVINRSEHHSVRMHVGAWEIPVLQYEYTPEKVQVEGFKRDSRKYPDANQEFVRLEQRYGIDTDNGLSKAALAYGQGAMGVMNIARMIEQERKTEAEEGDALSTVNTVQNVVVDEERIREAKEANAEAAKQAAAMASLAGTESPLVAQLMEQNKLLMQLLAAQTSKQGADAPAEPIKLAQEASKSTTLGLPKAKSA